MSNLTDEQKLLNRLAKDAAVIANDMVSWNDPDAGRVFRPDNGRAIKGNLALSIEPMYLSRQDDEGRRTLRIIAREAIKASIKQNTPRVANFITQKVQRNG
jgi:hypothetical protein